MSAFSFYQFPTSVFDSFLVPNTTNKMHSLEPQPEEDSTIIATKPYFAANDLCSHQEISLHAEFHETNGPLHSTEMAIIPIDDHQVTEIVTSYEVKKRMNVNLEKGKGKVRKPHLKKQKKKETEEASPSGYVHLRARRGQATDSRSLAERLRRAKISVRMELLQSLVPGCDKITGKVLILDEIIKYVLTLQAQVEFLAEKLASLTPMFSDSELHFITNPLAQEATTGDFFYQGN